MKKITFDEEEMFDDSPVNASFEESEDADFSDIF
jgi:hypothetical protein